MGKDSRISWTDHTFNPWEGCTKVSPGCAHCYAETRNARFGGGKAPNWGKGAPRRRTSAANWKDPLKWNRASSEGWFRELYDEAGEAVIYRGDLRDEKCPKIGSERKALVVRPRVFCASLADWLDDEVPIEWLADLVKLMFATQHLYWQNLTKRPRNWRGRMQSVLAYWARGAGGGDAATWLIDWLDGNAPANVWIGTTVEGQTRADERIPLLLSIPAKVRFLSCEPLLGPVDLDDVVVGNMDSPEGEHHINALKLEAQPEDDDQFSAAVIHWVICGGESGPGARSMDLAWAESLREQCEAAGVPFFMKQLGAAPVADSGPDVYDYPITDKKGDIMAEWPEALRVQQFPEVAHV